MTRSFLGRPIATGDATDPPAETQKFEVQKRRLFRAVRVMLIFYGDPVFTSITMKLYADRGGSPAGLLAASSTSRSKASFSPVWASEDHGFVECAFTFPDYALYPGTTYHLGLVLAGYTGNQGSHVSWASGWPQPIHREGVTLEQKEAGRMPLHTAIIGSRF